MIQNMEKEDICRKTPNTEYVPTKCRITRPPPPKPATNPLQFVKVGPCPLYKKAQEQIKKAKDVKVVRKEVREEAEDWQHNLDSWKSSRRKRQEHIIERVEEVKKLEQEGHERTRKQKTTFNDILEKRGRGRPKINIPIYDDDSNDLSDYGIGLGSSKSDKSSDNASQTSKEDLNECQNSEYRSNDIHDEKKTNDNDIKTDQLNNHVNDLKAETSSEYTSNENNIGQYTYEGAIQNYRMRIKTKINVNEMIFNNRSSDPPKNKEYTEVQSLLPKGNIFKRKELFESERNSIDNSEIANPRKFSEDFANSQSIKERLQSLEKCTESLTKNDNKNALPIGTVTSKLQKFNSVSDNCSKTNKNNFGDTSSKSISNYSLDGLSSGGEENKNKWGEKYEDDQYFSPEDSIFMDKINMFNRDLDTLYPKSSSDNCTDEFMNSYPPSTSSTELMVLSSDKEDSGIHTADVSCSVSQSDEVLEDVDISSNTIPKCIEKLNIEKITKENIIIGLEQNIEEVKDEEKPFEEVNDNQHFICNNIECVNNDKEPVLIEKIEESFNNLNIGNTDITIPVSPMDMPPFDMDCLADNVLLSPILPKLQPPAVKPPPPPVSDVEQTVLNVDNDTKFNTTKRLKKEILIKRSTFLGLDEPTDDQIFPNVPIEKPPDVNNFLQTLNGNGDGSSKEDISTRSPVLETPVLTENSDSSSIITKIQQNFEEDEITKKEREIIELIEKEEKSKDHEPIPPKDYPNLLPEYTEQYPYNYNNPYYLDPHLNDLDDRDSEVLKVEHELLQLEKEEHERRRENMLFHEKSMKMKQNYHSYENLCDVNVYPENADYYKSMPDLQQFPKDYNKPPVSNHKPLYDNLYYRKSMPDIEHAYNDSDYGQQMIAAYNSKVQPSVTANHRKTSMPELQKVPPAVQNLPIIPAKPLKRPTKEEKEMFKRMHYEKQMKPIARHSLQPSSASRLKHHDNWRPKTNAEPKNYNQHWLIQEAEFRRISEKQNSMPSRMHETHLNNYGNRNPPIKPSKPEPLIQKDNNQLSHLGQAGYALMPYSSSTGIDDSPNVILSVSGKKKCSYCGNELGRGAAMIIETLNLFYHMECFKCCVCHVELGDGLMGTDVRVRNQKLHCHNCYSSDDGIKFSCV